MSANNWIDIAVQAVNLIDNSKTINDPNIDIAKGLLKQAINLKPDKAWPYIKYIDIESLDINTTISYLELADTVEPNNLWVHIKLLNLYISELDIEKASKSNHIISHIAKEHGLSDTENNIVQQLNKKFYVMNQIQKLQNIKILCSTLCFYDKHYDISNIKLFLEQAIEFQNKYGIVLDVIVRNNSNKHNEDLEKLKQLPISLSIENSHNIGFGAGHNKNLLENSSTYDYYLILNDDLNFNNLDWLCEGLIEFSENPTIGIVGGLNNPCVIDKYGFGYFQQQNIDNDYVDGSIMLIKPEVFKQLNGFDDESFAYFYFEDADLCLRARQRGFNLGYIHIPHKHNRSSTTSSIPGQTIRSIVESNRAKFLTKWSGYLNTKNRQLNNNALIKLTLDGIGDIVDCFYPTVSLVDNLLKNNISIDIYCTNSKIRFLYDLLQKKGVSILDYDPGTSYDSIYQTNHINFSYPFHTMDMIAGALGVDDFKTDPSEVKDFINELGRENHKVYDGIDYVAVHIDSQRSGFEARAPKSEIFIPTLKLLLQKKYNICLLGQNINCDLLTKFIQQNKHKIIDARNISIQDTVYLINSAKMFFGIDSGPSHIAQLLDIPSYIIYGPVHPLTKVYRNYNTGCYFKNNHTSGLYHRNLQPSYYYDLTKLAGCINIDPDELAQNLCDFIDNDYTFDWSPYYESLRSAQRYIANIYLQNPAIQTYNPMRQQCIGIKEFTDKLININNLK